MEKRGLSGRENDESAGGGLRMDAIKNYLHGIVKIRQHVFIGTVGAIQGKIGRALASCDECGEYLSFHPSSISGIAETIEYVKNLVGFRIANMKKRVYNVSE